MVKIRSREDLKHWLQGQPREVAVAIAARAALRVLPVVETWLREEEQRAITHLLPLFHATAASRIAATHSTRDVVLLKAVRTASNAATRAAASAGSYSSAIASSAAFTSDAAPAAYTADIASAAYAATYVSTANPTTYAEAVTYVAAATTATASLVIYPTEAATSWENVRADIDTIANGKSAPDIIKNSLWPNGMPDWANDLWRSMKRRLLAREGEHWEVWTEWYDTILDPATPRPCYSPPNWELERERVLLPDALWQQGPAVVNAEIKKLIEKYRSAGKCPQPEKPPHLPGVKFKVNENGQVDVVPQPPERDEATDPDTRKIFSRLKQRVAELADSFSAVGNQYPVLSKIIREYEEEISVASLDELDISILWMVGQGLMAQAEAFRQAGEEVLTPPLEPETQGLLMEVAGLHAAFIMRFAKGRELVQARLEGMVGPDYAEKLKKAEEQFLDAFLNLQATAKTERAEKVAQEARDLLRLKALTEEKVLRATVPIAYNMIGAIAEALLRVSNSRASDWTIAALGVPGLFALANFILAVAGPVAAIAQLTPEMRAYIHHLFACYGWELPDDPASE